MDSISNDELWAVWADFAKDDSLDVGILTGAGKAFCSGADLKTFIPKWEKANMLDVRRNVPTGIGGGITRGIDWKKRPMKQLELFLSSQNSLESSDHVQTGSF